MSQLELDHVRMRTHSSRSTEGNRQPALDDEFEATTAFYFTTAESARTFSLNLEWLRALSTTSNGVVAQQDRELLSGLRGLSRP